MFVQVRHRLFAIFVLLAIITGIVGALGRSGIVTIAGLSDRATQRIIPSIKALQDLRFTVQRIAAEARDRARHPEGAPVNREMQEKFHEALSRYLDVEGKLPHPSPERMDLLGKLGGQFMMLCGGHRIPEIGRSPATLTECIDSEERLLSLLDELIRLERRELETTHRLMDRSIGEATRTIILGSGAALLLAIVSAILMSRAISRPLREIRDGAERLREGNYSSRIARYGLDEFGDLAVTFNELASSLESARADSLESRRYLENVIATMGEAVIVTAAGLEITLANEAARNLLSLSTPPDRRFDAFFPEKEDFRDIMETIRADRKIPFRETLVQNAPAETIPVELAASSLSLPGGIPGIVWILHDIRERKQSEEEIRRLAFFDPLSGLPNRSLFQDRFTQALHMSSREKRYIAIVLIDLDRFKEVNETLGHSTGDELLRKIAGRLSSLVRRSDTLARLGGDEFVVMAPSASASEGVAVLAQKILDRIAEPLQIDGRELTTTASIGISLFPEDGEDVDTLLARADMALYAAKERGKNRFCFYSSGMNDTLRERRETELRLRRAIAEGGLYLDYQPQYDLASNRLVSVEALVRWRDPERGLIPPDRFISVAEQSGLIHELGEWVLTEACRQGAAWSDEGLPPIRIAVNISGRQFAREDFIETIDRVLETTGLNPARLELELTESILMENTRTAVDTLVDFKVRGIHLAIDDFGTGYSSLSYLKFIPLDRLKIDRTFVRDIIDDPDDASIVTAIIGLSHSLGLKVIAEGVESAEQMAFLREHGCDEVQGYFTGKPMSPSSIASLLRHAS